MGLFRRIFHRKPPSDTERVSQWEQTSNQWRRSARLRAQVETEVGDPSDGETVVSEWVKWRGSNGETAVGEPSDGETMISERVRRRRSDGETVVGEQWEGETVVSERVRWRRSNGKTVVRRPRSVSGQSDGQTVVSEQVPWRPSDFQMVVPDLSDGEPLYGDPSCSEPLDNLVQISDRVYVFDSCFSTNVLEEDECKYYMDSTLGMLQCCFPDAAFMAFNFHRGNHRDPISDILSEYNMKLMDFPTDYGGFPLLPLQMIRNFLWSSVSWLLLEGLSGMNNVLLLHYERGGWPVLTFMLAALLLYWGHHTEEQKTLEMVYQLALRELLPLSLPWNPQPSHLRYLGYITGRDSALGWPPMDKPFNLECLVLNMVPDFDGEGGCRPMVHVYGQDPSTPANGGSKLLFSTPNIWYYRQVKLDLLRLKNGTFIASVLLT